MLEKFGPANRTEGTRRFLEQIDCRIQESEQSSFNGELLETVLLVASINSLAFRQGRSIRMMAPTLASSSSDAALSQDINTSPPHLAFLRILGYRCYPHTPLPLPLTRIMSRIIPLSPALYLFYIRLACRLPAMTAVPVSLIRRTTFKEQYASLLQENKWTSRFRMFFVM